MPNDASFFDDPSPSEDSPAAPGPKPLSHRASRALVIGSILFALAAAAGGTWLVLDQARSGPPPQKVVAPADTVDSSSMSNE